GGMLVADLTVGIDPHLFGEGLKLLFRYQDVVGGLIKSVFFGYIIALMGCYYGFETRGGAEGVGLATMKSVVSSCLLILVSNYMLANLIFRIIFAPD
ncbi:MAG: ABC transporter permease, partial [Candidatus Latescibacteria bacterium]|nr:ABC transporter permease [bacterium]MBD3423498.1 ABC transporter permease [Candidatus Latescibacterota bacterium]